MGIKYANDIACAHKGGMHNIANKRGGSAPAPGGHPGRMEKLRTHPGLKMSGHGNRTKLTKNARSPEQAKPKAYNPRTLQKKTFRSDALD